MMKWTSIKRFLPLIILALALACVIYFRLYRWLSFSVLQAHYQVLSDWVAQHYLLCVVAFIVIYVVSVALSIPGATVLTLAGGFAFGIVAGTVYVVLSATAGAVVLFLAVKWSLADALRRRAKGWVKRVEVGFQRHALSYLLFLRLVPIFPFWVVNIVPGLLGVSLRDYVLATGLGIIPGTLVYVSLGNGLGKTLQQAQTPDLSIIFSPAIFWPLIGLAVISLIPIFIKKRQTND